MPDIKDLIERLQREAHPTIGGKVYDPRATRPRRRLVDEAASALSRLEKENADKDAVIAELRKRIRSFERADVEYGRAKRAEEQPRLSNAGTSYAIAKIHLFRTARALTKESIDAKG